MFLRLEDVRAINRDAVHAALVPCLRSPINGAQQKDPSVNPGVNAWARENRKLAARTTLSKDVTDFVDQSLVFQVRRFDLRQLFQKLSLFARQHRRCYN